MGSGGGDAVGAALVAGEHVLRALDELPKAGSKTPWKLKQNYFLDIRMIRQGKVDDEALHFSKHRAAVNA